MNAKAVLRYLREKNAGFGREHRREDDTQLLPDGPTSGRYSTIELVTEDGELINAGIWVPVQRSTSTRKPAERTKGHVRGYLVDHQRNRAIGFESTHEKAIAEMALACPDVLLLEDQPSAVHFTAADGTRTKHTPDYRITVKTNKVFVAVKPTHQVEKTGIEDTIERLKPVIKGQADEMVLVTQKHATRVRSANAQVIRNAVRNRNAGDCEEMRRLVQDICGQVSLYALAERAAKYARGLNAAICLIHERVLVHAEPDRLLLERPFVRVAR
ncbi:hypothetical protein GB928_027655 [Shinella curvata]|uniref:TnsA endonuclease-like protein n=1 Tax=Shinella curvata TaxID=1817964 RepID=A0ABT8XMJ6_9HYPH|nr:hypothetical protein [Shinella curvata]MCJ8057189.1 hypothetical protein [Shinella curvata]MDO6124964.1 hypothetical protein [Shinella curvata]